MLFQQKSKLGDKNMYDFPIPQVVIDKHKELYKICEDSYKTGGLLTAHHLAEYYGTTATNIREAMRGGTLPIGLVSQGGRTYVSALSLYAYEWGRITQLIASGKQPKAWDYGLMEE